MYILTDTELLEGEESRALFDNVLAFHVIQMGLQNTETPYFVERKTYEGLIIKLYVSPNWEGRELTGYNLVTYHGAKKLKDPVQRRAILQTLYSQGDL